MANPLDGPWDPPLDLSLVRGFGFTCRPDCGLCCYATPHVTPDEKARLLQIEPSAPFILLEDEGTECIEARPDGGACHFLDANQCRIHTARPRTCQRFPINIHLGARAQASVILSCPGLSLDPLDRAGMPTPIPGPTRGLDAELAAVAETFRAEPVGQWLRTTARDHELLHRRLSRVQPDSDPAQVRLTVAEDLPKLSDVDIEGDALPPIDGDLSDLPMVFVLGRGRLALGRGPDGWEAVTLRESGGVKERFGPWELPTHARALDPGAKARWEGYLRYLLGRDHILDVAYLDVRSAPRVNVPESVRGLLLEAGEMVIGRAWLLASLRGDPPASLGVADIDLGIRATDADIMDVPSLGRNF